MKINHETMLDNKDFTDNDFKNPTPLKKEEGIKKPQKTKMAIPKRSWSFSKENGFYIIHMILAFLSLIVGGIMGHASLFVFFIPYVVTIMLAYRLGGEMKANGLHHVMWNLSVLSSTYTNANMRALRERRKAIGYAGLGLMITGALFSGLLLIIGVGLTMLSLFFAFSEQDNETISNFSKQVSQLLLIGGVGALMMNPLVAHGVFILSLFYHYIYEKWNEYEFIID